MSKITITVSGPVGVGKSTVCAKLETMLKHLGCQVKWIGGQEEKNLTSLEDWSEWEKTPIEIVERNESWKKIYETYSGQEGWQQVSQAEYDRTKDQYEHRIRRIPAQDIEKGDGPCVESDGCPTERAVLQRFWRAHAGHPPTLIDTANLDELIGRHSEWTPQGFAMVDSHRHKFAKDLLALVSAKAMCRDENMVELAQPVVTTPIIPHAEAIQPIRLEHVAVAEDGGKIRWMTARRPRDCELYAMPSGGRAPAKLYAAPQPTLTEAQVAAIEFAIGFMDGNPPCMKDVAILEELLKGLA